MDLTTTITEEYLSWDSAFPISGVAIVAVCCGLLMAWSLFCERRILGQRFTGLFGLLRFVAMATVVFMLLGPTSVVEESSTTKKAIAVMTDISGSMTTVDPPGTADDLRWAAMQSDDADSDIVRQVKAADAAVVALEISQHALRQAVDSSSRSGAPDFVARHVQRSRDGIQRAQQHLNVLSELADSSTQSYVNRLTELLDSPEFDLLNELARDFDRGHTPTASSWREGLSDMIPRTATAVRVMKELSLTLAETGTQQWAESDSSQRRFQSQSRAERIAALWTNKSAEAVLNNYDEADWRWTVFDESDRPLPDRQSLSQSANAISDMNSVIQQTDLAQPLQSITRMKTEQPVAATFLFTDVAHNHDTDRVPTELAGQIKDSPVYVVPIGNSARLRDVDLVAVSAPGVAMRNDSVVIEATLEVYQCDGETCVIQLLQDGQVVDFRNIPIDSDSTVRTVRFDQRVDEIGLASFEVSAVPLDGELSLDNNTRTAEINVTRSDIKVLLADELPRWEYRYLAQLFRRDPKVELDELLYAPRQIATGRRQESASFPVDADDWNQYDVVILGDLSTDYLSTAAQESMVDYLRSRGGTVILIAGQKAMPEAYANAPLGRILPVKRTQQNDDSKGYAFQVTSEGRSHNALMIAETQQATRQSWDFVNRFSPLYQVSEWRQPLPTAISLIDAVPRSQQPSDDALFDDEDSESSSTQSTFLCWQKVGRGRVIYLSAPDTYRLRFLRGDSLHYRFWGQLMRWAIATDLGTGNEMVRIRTNRTVYSTDQSVNVEIELSPDDVMDAGLPAATSDDAGSFSGEAVQLRVTTEEQERIVPTIPDPERPGIFRAEISGLDAGRYQVTPFGPAVDSLQVDSDGNSDDQRPVSTSFRVRSTPPAESVDTRCNRALAAKIAELAGGQVLPPTAVAEVLALTDLEPVITHTARRQPLWLRWKYLWLVFGCLQTEWIIRKWKGLS